MFRVIFHGKNGLRDIGEWNGAAGAIKIAKDYLRSHGRRRHAVRHVVTVWDAADTLVATVVDDANGLAAYKPVTVTDEFWRTVA